MQKRILSGFLACFLSLSLLGSVAAAEDTAQLPADSGSSSVSEDVTAETGLAPEEISSEETDPTAKDADEQPDDLTTVPRPDAEDSAGLEPEQALPDVFPVTVADGITGGSIAVGQCTAAEGEPVTVTVTPDEGMQLASLTWNGEALEAADGVYSFVMPAEAVELNAVFEAEEQELHYLFSPTDRPIAPGFQENSDLKISTAELDVANNSWFHEQIADLAADISSHMIAGMQTPSENDLLLCNDLTLLSGLDDSSLISAIQQAIDALKMDHPEIFWLRIGNGTIKDGISAYYTLSGGQITSAYLRFSGDGIHGIANMDGTAKYGTAAAAASAQAAMNAVINRVVAAAPDGELEKLQYFHDYVAANTVYNSAGANTLNNGTFSYIYSPTGVFLTRSAVCEGYSKAFKLLCDKAGLTCIEVVGSGNSSGQLNHMWNYVEIDGGWYLVDTTHDDKDAGASTDASGIKHTYFLNTWDGNNYHLPIGTISESGKVFTYPELNGAAYPVSITTKTVAFKSNGGSYCEAALMISDNATVSLPTTTRSGYTFNGWYNGGTLWTSSTPVTGNLTLTASWITASSATTTTSGGSGGGGGGGGGSASANLVKASAVSRNATTSINAAVAAAIKNKLAAATVSISIPSGNEISPAAVKSIVRTISAAAKGKPVAVTPMLTLTKASNGKLVSSISFNPLKFTSKTNIKLGVAVDDKASRTALSKVYRNKMQLIKFSQTGAFGMDVTVTAKLDFTGFNQNTLRFYTYDRTKKALVEIAAPNFWFDQSGNLHFTTNMGNTVIVTDSALVKK